MPHVVLLRPLHPDAVARLEAEPGFTVETVLETTRAKLEAAMAKADAVIVRATPIDEEFLGYSPKLSIVARHGVGYDAVDVPALTRRGIPLTVTADANALSVAEHALTLMLSIAKQVQRFDANTRAFKWSAQDAPTAYDLAGMTVLVVGFGRIGGRVARLCAAFGMDVLVHDPNVPMNTVKGAGFRHAKTLAEGLAQADWVTLHCPSMPETRGLVDERFLAALKPGARLINTARGTLVKEAALAEALRRGHVAAAGLDVFETEPVAAPNPFFDLPNVIMTPHSAAGTEQGMRRMGLSAAASVIGRFNGALDPDMVINKEVLRGNS
jgi:D-3-phosphoglycerate dehydrogenase